MPGGVVEERCGSETTSSLFCSSRPFTISSAVRPHMRRSIHVKHGAITINMPLPNASEMPMLSPIEQSPRSSFRFPDADQLPAISPRMPEVPQGGHGIDLKNGAQLICRFAPPPGSLPPSARQRYAHPPDAPGSVDGSAAHRYGRCAEPVTAVSNDASAGGASPSSPASDPQEAASTAVPASRSAMLTELREAILAVEVLPRVIDLFRLLDLDKNGTVSRDEFRRCLPLLNLRGYALRDMDVLFDAIDTDGNGSLEYPELYQLLKPEEALAAPLRKGAVQFQVRDKGASTKLRKSAKDPRFQATPLRAASLEEIRGALSNDRTRVIDAFRCLDKNGDGTVTMRGFRACLPLLGFENTPQKADQIFRELDADGSGRIEYEELNQKLRQGATIELSRSLKEGARVVAYDRRPLQTSAPDQAQISTSVGEMRFALAKEYERIMDIFKACDLNRDGYITKAEFRVALPTLGLSGQGGRAAIDELFESFDLDGNGQVTFQELNTMLRYEARVARQQAAREAL